MIELKQLCVLINGHLHGDPGFSIRSVNSLEKAGPDEITFTVKDNVNLDNIKAGALIVGKNSKLTYPNLVIVESPILAFAQLLEYFFPHKRFNEGVHNDAVISPTARIGTGVSIGPFTFIGDHTEIGDNCEIHPGVHIYHHVKIGKNCLIYAGVVIREGTEIGSGVIIQPGAVIGSDGFGYNRGTDGIPRKIPQKGKVRIGDNCEIGANTCIDRSTIETTILDEDVKLDNLVQIGHNVKIGRGSAFSGLVGVSGSVVVGKNVIMAGQAGVADHVKIGDGVQIAGKCGVSKNIPANTIVGGIPQQEIRQWGKSVAIFKNLEKYIDRIRILEQKIKRLEEKEK